MWGDMSYLYTTVAAARCMVKYGQVFGCGCPMLPTIIINLPHPDRAPFPALAIIVL